jgi:hypothetical protein
MPENLHEENYFRFQQDSAFSAIAQSQTHPEVVTRQFSYLFITERLACILTHWINTLWPNSAAQNI